MLIDEIEKAHPEVATVFLQAFDAGRLTNLQGEAVDLQETTFVVTTNLGAATFAKKNLVGFGEAPRASADADEKFVRDALRDRLSAEFVNRIDEVIVFRPLTREHAREIVVRELDQTFERMREHGYEITYDETVVDLVLEQGYSREYGARELHRTIQRVVLRPLSGKSAGVYFLDNQHESALELQIKRGQPSNERERK